MARFFFFFFFLEILPESFGICLLYMFGLETLLAVHRGEVFFV
jgi:hypothetical protein